MKKVTPEFIKDIFYSGQFGFSSDIEITNKIAFLVNQNYLILRQVYIASKSEFLNISSDQGILEKRSEASGGGNSHVALKLLAERYLLDEYGVDSLFEQPFTGFIPDVRSLNGQIICECGHTDNAEKIFTYLRHPDIRYVIQIPYPTDMEDTIFGYEFQSQPNLFGFLEMESTESNQKIKDILNNR